jgi:diguanylate cyclase (GGDEF)-like protein/putative nucleotidyltransferase with HDIG domain
VIPGLAGNISVAFLFTMFALLELSFIEALLVALLAVVGQTKWKSNGSQSLFVFRFVFNVCCVFLPTIAAILVVERLRPFHSTMELVIGSLALGLIYFLVNTGLVCGMLSVAKRQPFVPLWRETFLWQGSLHLIGAVLVGSLTLLEKSLGQTVLLVAAPVALFIHRYHSMKMTSMEEAQTRLRLLTEHVREMNGVHMRTVEALALAIGAKDEVTGSHLNRVRVYCREFGRMMGLEEQDTQALDAASLLHDIGKLAVPEHILSKPGKLTPEEFEQVKLHPKIGAEILERVEFPYPVVPIVRHHHEQWAGAGYPDGLSGVEIPIGARILSVVDCFDALVSDRPYRKGMPVAEAVRIIVADSGTRYDPEVVALLETHCDRLEKMAKESDNNLAFQDLAPVVRGEAPAAGFATTSTPATPNTLSASAAAAINLATNEAQTLLDVFNLMVGSKSYPDLIERVGGRLERALGFEGMVVYGASEGGRIRRDHCYGILKADEAASSVENQAVRQAVAMAATAEAAAGEGQPMRTACAMPLFGSERELVGVMCIVSNRETAFTRDHVRLLSSVTSRMGVMMQLLRMHEAMALEARLDPLTGAGNRRDFEDRFWRMQQEARRRREKLYLGYVDINHFKEVNDAHGHGTGDQVLCCVCDALRDACGAHGAVFRFGGDEFVLTVADREAEDLAEFRRSISANLRRRLRQQELAGLELELSLGFVAVGEEAQPSERYVAAADVAMYRDKQEKRPAPMETGVAKPESMEPVA